MVFLHSSGNDISNRRHIVERYLSKTRIPAWIRKFHQKRVEGDIIYAVHSAAAKFLPKWIFDHANLVLHRGGINARPVAPGTETFRWATERDSDRLIALGIDRKQIITAFESGCRIALCERDGKILAHHWIATDRHVEGGWLAFRIGPKCCMGTWIWVAPEERGNGLAQRLSMFKRNQMAAEGYTKTVGLIDVRNNSSHRSAAKLGSKPEERLSYLHILGFTLVRHGKSRRFGFWHAGRPLEIDLS